MVLLKACFFLQNPYYIMLEIKDIVLCCMTLLKSLNLPIFRETNKCINITKRFSKKYFVIFSDVFKVIMGWCSFMIDLYLISYNILLLHVSLFIIQCLNATWILTRLNKLILWIIHFSKYDDFNYLSNTLELNSKQMFWEAGII